MTTPHFDQLLHRSSLGTPAVRRLAARTPTPILNRLLAPEPKAPPMPNRRIVQPNPEGGWDVTARDAHRASAHTTTQAEAITRAREIVTNLGGGEVEIRGRNGRIRDVDTIAGGHDPYPPRG